MLAAQSMEAEARRKESLANLTKNAGDIEQAHEMYMESIKAKLSLLQQNLG